MSRICIKKFCTNYLVTLAALLLAHSVQALEAEQRIYHLEGAKNFRDFGGYQTEDGRQVKWGLLYRSNQPAGMTTSDYRTVSSLGLSTVVDFRTAEEREAGPTQWQGNTEPKFTLLPMGETERLKELEPAVQAALEAGDVQKLKLVGVESYRLMPVEYAEEFGQLLQLLADPQSLPLMLHCHAGKDRTGIGAALVLSMLGVPREVIMEDYLLSNELLLSPDDGRSAIEKLYWSVQREWLQASFDAIDNRYGSVEKYVETALGLDVQTVDRIRNNLLY